MKRIFNIGDIVTVKNILPHPLLASGSIVNSKIIGFEELNYGGHNDIEYLTETENGVKINVRQKQLERLNTNEPK